MRTIKTVSTIIYEKYRSLNAAVKVSLWLTICSVVQKGMSVLTMPIFTRIMSTKEFGRYSIFLSWYHILLLLITLNVQAEVFNKGLSDHSEQKDEYTANQAGLLLALTAVAILLYSIFRHKINAIVGLTTPLFILVTLEILGNAIFGLWCTRQQFDFRYKAMSCLTLLSAVVTPILGIFTVSISEMQAEAKIFSNAIMPVVMGCGILCVLRGKGLLFANFSWWNQTVLAALPLVPHYLSQILLNQSDKIMIDIYSGPEDAALYSVAHTAGLLMVIVNGSVNASYVPWSYRSLKKNKGAGIKQISQAMMLLIAAVNLLVIWVAPEMLRLFAAPQYAKAVYSLVPIAVSVYFMFVYTLFVDMEIYYSGNRYIAAASVLAAVVNVALNAVYIPHFGYIAAAYTTLITYFLTMILHFAFLSIAMRKQKEMLVRELFSMKWILMIGGGLIGLSVAAILLYPWWIVRWGILVLAGILLLLKREQIRKYLAGILKFS